MPTRSASVQFRQQRSGRVVTITSNAGLGDSGGASSAAASEGIVGMTRTAARDLGRYGVTCNAIAMSATSHDGSQSAAALAATLCLDDSSHVNGIVFGVDGGDILTYSNPAAVRSFHKWARPRWTRWTSSFRAFSSSQWTDERPPYNLCPGCPVSEIQRTNQRVGNPLSRRGRGQEPAPYSIRG